MATLEYVWQLTDEWDKAWEKFKGGAFWTIQTDEMEITAQTLFRKLTRLSRELKDKKYFHFFFLFTFTSNNKFVAGLLWITRELESMRLDEPCL